MNGSDDTDHRWECDVVVVGAGPAGSAAAIEAARGGLRTVLIDKARFPRDKCCGDGLTAGALRQLEDLGLDPALLPSWIQVDDVRLVSPRGREVVFPLPAGSGQFAAVCRRRELDAALVDLARQAGVTVLEGHELRDVVQESGFVRASTGDITFDARHLIAADGMWSTTRKLLGVSPAGYRGEWHAFRQYFTGVTGPAADHLIVWFEPDLLPGYAWSFPVAGGVANVGFGIQRGRRYQIQDMKQLWPDLLARPALAAALGPHAEPEGPHRAWPIPARVDRVPLSLGRVLFVGDAASATDPMTGEGIGQALETGRAAARAVLTAPGGSPTDAANRYRQSVAGGLVPDHRLARALSTVLARPATAEASIAIAGISGWTRRNFGRWLFEDYPRAVLLTPRRWHRGMFSAPGAYRSPPTDSPHAATPEVTSGG